MKDSIVVSVTKKDIELGDTHSIERCAIGRAVARAFKTTKIRIDRSTFAIDDKDYPCPRQLKTFQNIGLYRGKKHQRPVSFKIHLNPIEVLNG